jgi:hypothetical protein
MDYELLLSIWEVEKNGCRHRCAGSGPPESGEQAIGDAAGPVFLPRRFIALQDGRRGLHGLVAGP